MLAIKFQRIGKKHQPSYRIVVAEKRSKLGGPPVEDLGFYNPFTKTVNMNTDRLRHWLGVGAQPTVTVWNLLVRERVLSDAKRAVKTKVKKAETSPEAPKAATEGTPAAS